MIRCHTAVFYYKYSSPLSNWNLEFPTVFNHLNLAVGGDWKCSECLAWRSVAPAEAGPGQQDLGVGRHLGHGRGGIPLGHYQGLAY